MAQWLDFKGKIVDAGHARSRKAHQFFYLVQDLRTSIQYPVFVTVERKRGRGAGEPKEETFEVGDTVRVAGKMQPVIGIPLAGMKMIQQSDVQNTGPSSRPFSNAVALIPEEMERVEGPL